MFRVAAVKIHKREEIKVGRTKPIAFKTVAADGAKWCDTAITTRPCLLPSNVDVDDDNRVEVADQHWNTSIVHTYGRSNTTLLRNAMKQAAIQLVKSVADANGICLLSSAAEAFH